MNSVIKKKMIEYSNCDGSLLHEADYNYYSDSMEHIEELHPDQWEDRMSKCRERNREHAKKTRLRKKMGIDGMKQRLLELQNEASKLQQQLEESSTANILLHMGSFGSKEEDCIEDGGGGDVKVKEEVKSVGTAQAQDESSTLTTTLSTGVLSKGNIIDQLRSSIRAETASKNQQIFDQTMISNHHHPDDGFHSSSHNHNKCRRSESITSMNGGISDDEINVNHYLEGVEGCDGEVEFDGDDDGDDMDSLQSGKTDKGEGGSSGHHHHRHHLDNNSSHLSATSSSSSSSSSAESSAADGTESQLNSPRDPTFCNGLFMNPSLSDKNSSGFHVIRKERNRIHAKLTRDRKKLFTTRMQQMITALERQNNLFRYQLLRSNENLNSATGYYDGKENTNDMNHHNNSNTGDNQSMAGSGSLTTQSSSSSSSSSSSVSHYATSPATFVQNSSSDPFRNHYVKHKRVAE